MDLINGISNLMNFGIDLKLRSYDAEAFYIEALRQWFEREKGYYAEIITDREFNVNMGYGDIASVFIEDSILRMRPIMDDPYEILICLLEFIADNHHKTIQVYDYLEENEEEILDWPTSDLYESKAVDELKKIVRDSLKEDVEKEEDIEDQSEEESDEWI